MGDRSGESGKILCVHSTIKKRQFWFVVPTITFRLTFSLVTILPSELIHYLNKNKNKISSSTNQLQLPNLFIQSNVLNSRYFCSRENLNNEKNKGHLSTKGES